MIKTVKVKKQLRLDELIKYIFDNKIVDKKFSSDIECDYVSENSVYVHSNGTISLGLGETNEITPKDTYTVEVEEEITEDTEFVGIQEIFFNKENEELEVEIHAPLKRKTINDVLEEHDEYTECRQIYALIYNNLELIWEAE